MRRAMGTALLAAAVTAALLTGCGPKTPQGRPSPGGGGGIPPGGSPSASASAVPAVKDITPGNCTLYSKADAVKLLGTVGGANKSLPINTGAGKRIDVCSYLNVRVGFVEGLSYAVVRFDTPAAAAGAVQQVRTEVLTDAAEHDWAVQSLSTPVPGAGPVLGGTGTKTDEGVTYTIAMVGTNVGPYLVVVLGASSVNADNAKKYALTPFQALAVTVS